MASRILGFAGIDKYEFILYLSRIIFHLGLKVLLVDDSESQALYQCIPVPETLKEADGPIHYRGIDFMLGQYYRGEISCNYDVVLLDLGFIMNADFIYDCNCLYYVTDLQLHNIQRMKQLIPPESIPANLIIKDVVSCKIRPEYIIHEFLEELNIRKGYIIYMDSLDLKCKIHSQYDSIFQFRKISEPVKELLIDMIRQMDLALPEKGMKKAYEKAERGN